MSEADEDCSSNVGTRVPTFDGDKANWPFYKKKLESYQEGDRSNQEGRAQMS